MYTAITQAPIDVAELLARIACPADGAVVLFVGVVREQNEGRPVSGMHYEAYASMAERVLAQIVEEAAARLGSDRIAVVHRTGELKVGDASVAIAVGSPHRAEAYDASRSIIEEIKRRLPVWKQERYLEGDARWLEGTVPPALQATHE